MNKYSDTTSEERMDLVCRFSGNLAHELNNLLTPIVVCTQMLKEDAGDPDAIEFNAEQIADAGSRIQALAKKLIAIGSRQNATGLVRPATVLGEAARKAGLSGDPPPRIVEPYRTRPGSSEWAVKINPEQFEFIVTELIRNAAEAMPSGGSITLDMMPDERAGSLVISVADEGTGIAAADLPHVFEPFFTTRSKTRDRGLGLTMVYGMVRRAGGSITCENLPEHGSVFRVTLPLQLVQTA